MVVTQDTSIPCLASGDGPKSGCLPDLVSLFFPSLRLDEYFSLFDFFADRFPNPSTTGYATDKGYPHPWSRGLLCGGEMTVVPSFLAG